MTEQNPHLPFDQNVESLNCKELLRGNEKLQNLWDNGRNVICFWNQTGKTLSPTSDTYAVPTLK